MTAVNPAPSVTVKDFPDDSKGTHGVCVIRIMAKIVSSKKAKVMMTKATIAVFPTDFEPRQLITKAVVMTARFTSHCCQPVIPGQKNFSEVENKTGYTAMSTKVNSHVHQPS